MKKYLLKRKKRKKRKQLRTVCQYYSSIKKISKSSRNNDCEKVVVKAPINFSLINNAEVVTEFFCEVRQYLLGKKNKKTQMFFDLSKIENVTIDAIIYLLAMIKNLQRLGLAKYRFVGNLPQKESVREQFTESGFLDFVKSRICTIESNSNKIAIRTGQKNDSIVLKEICDFIIEKTGCSRLATKGLYVIMAEMMYNTSEHAYISRSYSMKNWYVFVEYAQERVKITFMDTGDSIPKTMRKKWQETFLRAPDDKMIISALNGECRSRTRLDNRNNGLPTIKANAEAHKIENLHILSNRAICVLCDKDGKFSYNTREQKKAIMGTLYYWEIPMKILRENDDASY